MRDILGYQGRKFGVTGAATGMGAAVALRLLTLGADVHALDGKPIEAPVKQSRIGVSGCISQLVRWRDPCQFRAERGSQRANGWGKNVPIYATGPGAWLFHGVQEESCVYWAMTGALG